MTQDEKIALALSDWEAVAHLGIPPLIYTDGGSGVRDADGITAFPAGIALAAAFDEELAERYGAAIAEEARAKGRNVLLGPAVDIARTPLAGRTAEAFGEDPYLSARVGTAHVRGVQSQGVIAMVKHFIANNFEYQRIGFELPDGRGPAVNVIVSERALQELYYPPFRAAVGEGGAGSVMGSYNRLNGSPACENRDILRTLKEDWDWPGFVAPDFAFAVRDQLAAVNAGLDVGALDGAGGRTADDFARGRVSAERLDDIVARILFAMEAVGLFDERAQAEAGTPAQAALAAEVASEATVLLKNRGAVLPLAASETAVAVIGGEIATYVITGSAGVQLPAEDVVTPLAGIEARAANVRWAPGSVGDVRLPVAPLAGLQGELWAGSEPVGEPLLTVTEPVLDLVAPAAALPEVWCARWTAELRPEVDGLHRLSLSYAGIAELYVDDVLVASGYREAERMVEGPEFPLQVAVALRADRPARVRVEYWTGSALTFADLGLHGPRVQMGWQPPNGDIEAAARLAADCDVAVVFAHQASGEGMDRCSLALPGDQDALIAAVAAANPRTVVVLNTGGPVLMPWLEDVAAVLHVWYPGQRYGEAIAAVLFGDAEPGGRLPVTFPASSDQGPATTTVDGEVQYGEGLLVGYRFYDAHAQQPLFPFGHGLSYTQFRYGEAQLERAGEALDITVEVENIGARPGTEVVQLYLASPDAAHTPPKQLKGFRKLRLAPGERTLATFRLEPGDLATFDGRWSVVGGRYEALIGRSSRDIRTRVTFERNN